MQRIVVQRTQRIITWNEEDDVDIKAVAWWSDTWSNKVKNAIM
jgi:hypothetical protein